MPSYNHQVGVNLLGENKMDDLCEGGISHEPVISPEKHHTETTVTRDACAVLLTNFGFWDAELWFPLLSCEAGIFKRKMSKSLLQSLSQLQKERLIFSVRSKIMKGRTSLADVPCFHQADSYLLGFICRQISTV